MKIDWIHFRVHYFLPFRALLTLGWTVPFWSSNPFWLTDIMQPVTLVCVKQRVYSSSQRPLAYSGDKQHFLLIWKEITGPETVLAAKKKLHPRAGATHWTKQLLFLYILVFKKHLKSCADILILFLKLLSVVPRWQTVLYQLGSRFHWTPQKKKHFHSDLDWGIEGPLAHFSGYDHISILTIPIFMTCTSKSVCRRQLHY